MATAADVISQAAASVALLTGTPVRLPDDHQRNHAVALGVTAFQLRGSLLTLDQRNSNAEYDVLGIDLEMVHRLADPTDERAYTTALMLTHQALVLERDFWRDLAAVHDLIPGGEPSIEDEGATRLGHVITYTMRVQLRVQP